MILEDNRNHFVRTIIENVPFPIAVYVGEEMRIEIANEAIINIWGKGKDVIGKKFTEVLPELSNQLVFEQIKEVWKTGKSFHTTNTPLDLLVNGKLQTYYFNYSFTPLYDPSGNIYGIMNTGVDLTDLNVARKKLERNQERLNIVIEASELGTWELNLRTREAIYSPRYFEIISGSKEHRQLTHEQLIQFLHPDDLGIREKALQSALATGNLHYEARLIWSDKSIHWMEGRGRVFYDEDQQPVKMVGTIRDITKERKHQQELEENEQKFRLLADSLPQHIWTSDIDGNLNYFNKSVIEYSGLSLEYINDNGWLEIVHPDDREENIKQWLNSIKTGEDFLLEHRFRRYDGQYRWQLSRAVPQRDAQGKIQMWVGTSTDIQDQKIFTSELERQVNERTKELKRLNETLKQSEERYHLMVEEVQDYAILYLSKEGIVENWNKGAEKIKGYKADEIIGKSFSTFYTEEEKEAGLPQYFLEQALKNGRHSQEGWRMRKNGDRFWASVVITAVHNNDNEVIGFSKMTHDLSSKKEADDKIKLNSAMLEQKNHELEKMNKELQSFAYISSHDLQEPLRKIQTFANQIIEREYSNLSETGKDKFQRMQNAAKRMQILINDLLAYSRTSTQERKFKKTPLKQIIEEVKEDMKEELLQNQAVIIADQLSEVNIIPFQFQQLMYNLISNSLKFAKQTQTPQIKIVSEIAKGADLNNEELNKKTTYCHIIFSDNGIGFEQQYGEKIFEVFQRLHGKDVYPGTGIGLAIVKKIIENHNGIITAKGKLNEGAQFDIYIPAF